MERISNESLDKFLESVYLKYGHDFRDYNYSTLRRRIESHQIKMKVPLKDFESYKDIVLENRDAFVQMFKHFSINVTEFFREPDHMKIFRDKVVPYLKTYPYIKIWYAGCSSGEFPYSLAILLKEEGLLKKSQIYATDFNNKVLNIAKKGIYEDKEIERSIENYKECGGKSNIKEYFTKHGKFYKVKNSIKENILFFNHNLVTDGVMNEFHLIICKNVLIYFNENLKTKVFTLFDNSLYKNGFLIIGKNEYLTNEFKMKYKLYHPKSKIYHNI